MRRTVTRLGVIGLVFGLVGCATPPPKTTADIIAAFQRQMLLAVDEVKRYPSIAVQAHERGTVVVSFDYSDANKISNIHIDQSSGFRSLDKEAIEAVISANFPLKPPELYSINRFKVALVFQIGRP